MRGHPSLSYVPCRLSLVPRLFATTLPPDVVVLHTTTPRDGSVSLGTEVNVLPAAVEAARGRGALVLAPGSSTTGLPPSSSGVIPSWHRMARRETCLARRRG